MFVGGGLTSTEEGSWALQQPRGGISHNLLRLTACTPSHKAQGMGSIPQPCPQPLRDLTNSDCANFTQSMGVRASPEEPISFGFLALPRGL